MTFAQLHENVRRYRAALQHAGVTVGDRVVGNYRETYQSTLSYIYNNYCMLLVYLSNCPEALIICLATASLGAIFSSASADFGVLV